MSFFFSAEKNKNIPAKSVSKETLHALECRACPLYSLPNKNRDIPPSGTDKPLIYFLAEAPGRLEDEKGEPLIGESGFLLKNTIAEAYIKMCSVNGAISREEVDEFCKAGYRFNNVVRTRPPRNATPEYIEIECCRPSVIRDIETIKPKLIVGLGNVPLSWALGVNNLKITAWRGRLIPVKIGTHKCWFLPTVHPASIIRSDKFKRRQNGAILEIERAFKLDIQKAQKICESIQEPEIYEAEDCYTNTEIIVSDNKEKDLRRIEELLEESLAWPYSAIDIETNCLRPYEEDSKILSISIGNFYKNFCFGVEHPDAGWTRKQKEKLFQLIKNWLLRRTEKIAQNLSFELEWFCYFFGKEVARTSIWHDTMAQAYILDSRKDALNLDALCLQHLGLELKKISPIDVKNLINLPVEDVLKYNVLDSKYTAKLFEIQSRYIEEEDLERVYREQIRRIPTLVLTQLIGMPVDQNIVKKHSH